MPPWLRAEFHGNDCTLPDSAFERVQTGGNVRQFGPEPTLPVDAALTRWDYLRIGNYNKLGVLIDGGEC